MAKWLQKRFKKQNLKKAEAMPRTCPNCGFDDVEPQANYCRMCGIKLREEKGNEEKF